MKRFIKKIPFVRPLARAVYFGVTNLTNPFQGSDTYWKQRYAKGGNSGDGSYNRLSSFKAEILNQFVADHKIDSVVEFGCGDGAQLALSEYPSYIGYDVSPDAIALCRERFQADGTKRFHVVGEEMEQRHTLAISLDVIFHLTEDAVFDAYMRRLFDSAKRYAVIYSSNKDTQDKFQAPHVRHRQFSTWIDANAPDWKLIRHVPNKYPYTGDDETSSFADFYFYEKTESPRAL